MRCIVWGLKRLFSLLLSLLLLAQGAEAAWLDAFSGELKEARAELLRAEKALESLGQPMIGNTAPEFGIQHRMMEEPPPESPAALLWNPPDSHSHENENRPHALPLRLPLLPRPQARWIVLGCRPYAQGRWILNQLTLAGLTSTNPVAREFARRLLEAVKHTTIDL